MGRESWSWLWGAAGGGEWTQGVGGWSGTGGIGRQDGLPWWFALCRKGGVNGI